MRLRDLPGLAAKLDKLVGQLQGYGIRLTSRRGTKVNPYTHAEKKKKRLKWE